MEMPVCRLLVVTFCRVMLGYYGGVRVDGRESLPRHGAVIIAPNHISVADPAAIAVVTPRPVYFMGKKELFATRFLGTMLRNSRAFPVDTQGVDRHALQYSMELLRRGEGLVMYPEGKVSETGRLGALHPGVILLAQRTGAPVMPVGVVGADRMMPYGVLRPRRSPTPVHVQFGHLIPVEELTGGLPGRAGLNHGIEVLANAIRALTGEHTSNEQAVKGTRAE